MPVATTHRLTTAPSSFPAIAFACSKPLLLCWQHRHYYCRRLALCHCPLRHPTSNAATAFLFPPSSTEHGPRSPNRCHLPHLPPLAARTEPCLCNLLLPPHRLPLLLSIGHLSDPPCTTTDSLLPALLAASVTATATAIALLQHQSPLTAATHRALLTFFPCFQPRHLSLSPTAALAIPCRCILY
ncbi:hypothetical protein GW17_00046054, partial [Ensete ventricosum]